jgi:hypothetical protein
MQKRWPALSCDLCAIGPGEFCWYVAAVAGADALIWLALAVLEYTEKMALTGT